MSSVAQRDDDVTDGGRVKLVDAFEERALAIAASAATPNTRRSHATTQIYVDVTDDRKADGIAALERQAHPLAV